VRGCEVDLEIQGKRYGLVAYGSRLEPILAYGLKNTLIYNGACRLHNLEVRWSAFGVDDHTYGDGLVGGNVGPRAGGIRIDANGVNKLRGDDTGGDTQGFVDGGTTISRCSELGGGCER